MCEIKRTYFRVLLFFLQYKILIFTSGANRQKKKKEAGSRCDLGASIGCEPFRWAFHTQRLLAQMLPVSFFFFVRYPSKFVFYVEEGRGAHGSRFFLFHTFSFRYWFSEKGIYFLSTGDLHQRVVIQTKLSYIKAVLKNRY